MSSDLSDQSRAARVAVPVLLSVAALALAVRALAVVEPLGIDQSLWASAARGMARGQALYRDVWEQRPPGIYFTYLSAFALLGWQQATVAWLDLFASALTTILLFDVARLLGGRLAGAAAAACYAVLTMPAWLYGYSGFLERSVSETFTVTCVAFAASAAARLHRGSSRTFLLFGVVGFATGMAVIYKPNAGLYLPALALWLWFYWPPKRTTPGSVSARLAPFALMGCMAALPTIATVAWLASAGLLEDARVAVVEFNRFYVTTGVTIDALALAFSKAIFLRMKTNPLWALGTIGAVASAVTLLRTRRLPPLAGLAVIWGGAAALVIFVNGIRLYSTYFMNALPPLTIMSAWLIVGEPGSSRARKLLGASAVVLMMVMLVHGGFVPRVVESARADWGALSGRIDRASYLERFGGYQNNRGYSARANEELAAYIAAHTHFEDRIFLFGVNGTAVYFLADRLTAHRFIRANFFVPEAFPHPAFTRAAVIRELEKAPPRYVIFERVHTTSEINRQIDELPRHPDVAPWLALYVLEAEIEDFAIYRRK